MISFGTGNSVVTASNIAINVASSGFGTVVSSLFVNSDTVNFQQPSFHLTLSGGNTNNTNDVMNYLIRDLTTGYDVWSAQMVKRNGTDLFGDIVHRIFCPPAHTLGLLASTSGSANTLTLSATVFDANFLFPTNSNLMAIDSSGNTAADVKKLNGSTTVDGVTLTKWANVLLAGACGLTNRTDSAGTALISFQNQANNAEIFRLTVDLSTGVRTVSVVD